MAVATAYVTAVFMTGIDMHIVNVALPTLSRTFGAALSHVQWTVLAYLLTLAVVTPASGWIGDRVGTKRTFLFALAMFTTASALCGLADSLPQLIAARALQGVGGGMLTPIGTAMLYRAYGPSERARVARTLVLPILVGPGAAPIIGGVLTQSLSWRWVFFVNVPVGVVMLVYSRVYLPEHRPNPSGRLDWVGMLLSGLGLSAMLYAISEGAIAGWSSPGVIAAGVCAVVLLWMFAQHALGRADPILRLRLLRDPLLRATNTVVVLTTGIFLASLYLTPIFLQKVVHQSPLGSGTTTFVEVIGVAIAAQTAGRLYPRVGPRVMCACGGLILTCYLVLFMLVDASTNVWLIRALMFAGGAGNAGTFLSIQTAMFTNISSADTGHASAIYNANRQSSIAIDIAVLTTIVALFGGRTHAFHIAYLVGAVIAAAGCVASWRLISTDAARSTMVTRSRQMTAR